MPGRYAVSFPRRDQSKNMIGIRKHTWPLHYQPNNSPHQLHDFYDETTKPHNTVCSIADFLFLRRMTAKCFSANFWVNLRLFYEDFRTKDPLILSKKN